MTVEDHAEDYARDMLGNRKHADNASFSLDLRDDIDLDDYVLIHTRTRDSDILGISNAHVIDEILGKYGEPDVFSGSASHWAFGWVDFYFVRPYDEQARFTAAWLELVEAMMALEEYPVLDESDYHRREYEAQVADIEDRVGHLVGDNAPEDWPEQVFGKLWNSQGNFDMFDDGVSLSSRAEEIAMQAIFDLGWITCYECSQPATHIDPDSDPPFFCEEHI